LWNEITREARIREFESFMVSDFILDPIRHHYDALHQDTDAASIGDSLLFRFPLCNISGHTVTGEITDPNLPSSVLPSFPSLSADHTHIHFAEQISLHDLPDVTPTIESSRNTPPANVDSSNVVTTSLDWIAQGPTDTTTMTTSPTSDSETSPHAPGLSTFTLHSSFTQPSSKSADLHRNLDLAVASDIPLLSSSHWHTTVRSDTGPEITPSSLASPAFPIDQVTAVPLPLSSTSATAIFPVPPDGISVSYPNTCTANDNIRDPRHDLRHNVDESQELAMSVPEVATDVLRHPLDAASVSRDIGHPE
jgi:hypothetical protein